LFLQPDTSAILRQAAGSKIRFENAKPQTPERVVGLPQHNPTPAIAAAFPAVQTGDDLPEAFDLIQFLREPTVQQEGSRSPLKEPAKQITPWSR
jgi:hypothetical protein